MTIWSAVQNVTLKMASGLEDYALFCNDLFACWNAADDNNREHIGDWLRFLHYEVPGESHGSVAEVEQWIKDGGYTGRYNKGKSPNEVVR